MRYASVITASDEIAIARLLRADQTEVRAYAAGLPESRRVHLALFCHARAHYRDLGLAIAKDCSRQALTSIGGYAGEFLADQAAREPAGGGGVATQSRRSGISLATGARPAAVAADSL